MNIKMEKIDSKKRTMRDEKEDMEDEDDEEEESSSEDEVTKNKRIKIEKEEEELNANALISIHEEKHLDKLMKIDVCEICGGFGGPESSKMLYCKECGDCYHSFCFNPPLRSELEELREDWQCPACKICEVCKNSENEEQMLVCDNCDKCLHTFCCDPPLKSVPEGDWKCNKCNLCLVCGKVCFTKEEYNLLEMKKKKGDTFGGCHTCVLCFRRVHSKCCEDTIDEKQAFFCSPCKKKFSNNSERKVDVYSIFSQPNNTSNSSIKKEKTNNKINKTIHDIKIKKEIEEEIKIENNVQEKPQNNEFSFIECSVCNKSMSETTIEGRMIPVPLKSNGDFADSFVHVNCALWSKQYLLKIGTRLNVTSIKDNKKKKKKRVVSSNIFTSLCSHCGTERATLECTYSSCNHSYHFLCAVKAGCKFAENYTFFCETHSVDKDKFHNYNFNRVLQNIHFKHSPAAKTPITKLSLRSGKVFRCGSIVVNSLGTILPKNPAYHKPSVIYPAGYHITRKFPSYLTPNKTVSYKLFIKRKKFEISDSDPSDNITISESEISTKIGGNFRSLEDKKRDVGGEEVKDVPLFKIVASDDPENPIIAESPLEAWKIVFKRKEQNLRQEIFFSEKHLLWQTFCKIPWIQKMIEFLPNSQHCGDYQFLYNKKKKKKPFIVLELSLSGCARTDEYKKKTKNPKQRISSNEKSEKMLLSSNLYIAPSKQDSSSNYYSYQQMRERPRKLVIGKSKIQGMGVYTLEPLSKGDMVIEYIGEIVRNNVADKREKIYDSKNIGCYMWKLDYLRVVDATCMGNLARFINHSCDPNCEVNVITDHGTRHVVIFAKEDIKKGEELSYNYMFSEEEVKIPCHCGAKICSGYMN